MGDVKPQKNESFNSSSLYFLIKKAQEKKNEKRVKIVSAEMRKILTEFFYDRTKIISGIFPLDSHEKLSHKSLMSVQKKTEKDFNFVLTSSEWRKTFCIIKCLIDTFSSVCTTNFFPLIFRDKLLSFK